MREFPFLLDFNVTPMNVSIKWKEVTSEAFYHLQFLGVRVAEPFLVSTYLCKRSG